MCRRAEPVSAAKENSDSVAMLATSTVLPPRTIPLRSRSLSRLYRNGCRNNGGESPFCPRSRRRYHQSIKDVTNTDGVMYEYIDVLAQDVGVEGIFSDWPGTVSYYASCMGLN